MFRKKKDKELDYTSLNEILKVGSKLADIFYVISIIAIILLGTYLLKEWKILNFIGEFLAVISPIFIGFTFPSTISQEISTVSFSQRKSNALLSFGTQAIILVFSVEFFASIIPSATPA